jgi:hypothetical protein
MFSDGLFKSMKNINIYPGLPSARGLSSHGI